VRARATQTARADAPHSSLLPRSPPISKLCRVINLERFAKNDIVFKQGDYGDKFYIIVQGRVEVRICSESSASSDPRQPGHNTVAWLHRGDSFGELALIKNAPRTASIIVPSSKTEVLSIHKESFERILVGLYGASLNERALFLRRLWTFAALPTRLVQQLATFTSVAIFQTGALFDTEKDNRLYFIVEGECRLCLLDEDEETAAEPERELVGAGGVVEGDEVEVNLKGKELRNYADTGYGFYNAKTISRLGPGNFFGEGCIFPEIRRDWIVEAMSEVKLYFISRGDILNNVDRRVIDIIEKEARFKATYYDGRFDGRSESRPLTRRSR